MVSSQRYSLTMSVMRYRMSSITFDGLINAIISRTGTRRGNFAHAQCITFISQHPRNSHEWSGLMDGWLAGWIELDWMVPYQDQELRFRHMIADWLQTVVLPEVSPYVRRLQHSTLKNAHSANLVVLYRI